MNKTNSTDLLSLNDEEIMTQIYIIRDQKIMIDKDLATLYRVETRVLKQAIKRNIDRFPKDFMFELTAEETKSLLREAELSNLKVFGGARPLAFTRLTIRLEIAEIKEQLESQNKKLNNQDKNIEIIFRYLDELQVNLISPQQQAKKIGFKPDWK